MWLRRDVLGLFEHKKYKILFIFSQYMHFTTWIRKAKNIASQMKDNPFNEPFAFNTKKCFLISKYIENIC